jgi:hypothetical protein
MLFGRTEGAGVGVRINISFSAGPEEAGVFELEGVLKDFLGAAGEVTCSGGGGGRSDVTLELAAGEDAEAWVGRLCAFLRAAGVRHDTFLAVFPDGWWPGQRWRRVEVYNKQQPGRNRRCT